MNGIHRTLAALTVALAAQTAAAGYHHICYQDITENKLMQVIVACQDDNGTACTIKPDQASVTPDPRYSWQQQPVLQGHPRIGMLTPFQAFQNAGSANLSFTLEFTQSSGGVTTVTTRSCQVAHRVNGEPSGVLTGYSTDESGLVTTGSWRVDGINGPSAKVWVPGDFIVTGGGFAVDSGSVLRPSMRYARANGGMGTTMVWNAALRRFDYLDRWESRTWEVSSYDPTGAPAQRVSAEVIGMHMEGMNIDTPTDLYESLKLFTSNSAGPAGKPETVVRRIGGQPPNPKDPVQDVDRVILGGDAWTTVASTSGVGQLLTASAAENGWTRLVCLLRLNPTSCPVPAAEQWRVGSVGASFPGVVSGSILTLTPTVVIKGQTYEVRSRLVTARSKTSQDPGAVASGLRGLYAVTGVGGQVSASATATRLGDVVPRLDIGGVSVSTVSSGAEQTRVVASAIGIRLVKPGTPPDMEEFPQREALAIDAEWICRVIPDLADSSTLCQPRNDTITLDAKRLCASYPELQKYGLCLKQ